MDLLEHLYSLRFRSSSAVNTTARTTPIISAMRVEEPLLRHGQPISAIQPLASNIRDVAKDDWALLTLVVHQPYRVCVGKGHDGRALISMRRGRDYCLVAATILELRLQGTVLTHCKLVRHY